MVQMQVLGQVRHRLPQSLQAFLAGYASSTFVVEGGYKPQPKQAIFHAIRANEVLYGGAAGPGKSHAIRHELYDWCLRIPKLQAYLFRRTHPELEKNHIIPALASFDPKLCKWNDKDSRFEFHNGSMLHMCHCQYEKDVFKYQGAEIDLLGLDELTTFTEFIYDYLRARVRPTLDVPAEFRWRIPGVVAGSNPGGIGHAWVKKRWIDYCQPMVPIQAPSREGGMVRAYVPGLLADNKILLDRDPTYKDRLNGLPEPYRTAYMMGDWNVFMGQAFLFDRAVHVVAPHEIPEGAPIIQTFDWGFAKPFSVGWWWIDPDRRLYRFHEWYGWNGEANHGMRLADPSIAQGIIQIEKKFKEHCIPKIRLAGPDCFAKRPDTKGGGQGPSTAMEFRAIGDAMQWPLHFRPGDPSRVLKIRQFQTRLQVPTDGTAPMLQVTENCEHFIRTIPLLQFDEKNPEDIDSDGEDHVYDESCHAMMLYKMATLWDTAEPVEKNLPPKDMTEAAWREHAELMAQLADDNTEF
jgi:hypothetical protein